MFKLVDNEIARNTEIGRQIFAVSQEIGMNSDNDVLHCLIVKMLKKIIYSGIEGRDKFILSEFPTTINAAHEFEKECTKLKAVIFAAGGQDVDTMITIDQNNLAVESIDSLFQKEHRLKAMRTWDESIY